MMVDKNLKFQTIPRFQFKLILFGSKFLVIEIGGEELS